MDNLGEMVSEVGDVVIIGRKCMNFRSLLCLKGKVEEMKMRGGKKKKRKEKKTFAAIFTKKKNLHRF